METIVKNYSQVFCKGSPEVTLGLLNSPKGSGRDDKGWYILTAISVDDDVNVTFRKDYLSPEMSADIDSYMK